MIRANGSAPTGEVKSFIRGRKHRFYEKTENGAVELSAKQYYERMGSDANREYERAKSETDVSSYSNGIGKTGSYRSGSGGDRIARQTAAVYEEVVGEKLPDDTGRSLRSISRDGERNSVIDTNAARMNADESKSVAEMQNPVRYSIGATDSAGNALTEAQREYFKDSKAVDENGNLRVVYQ